MHIVYTDISGPHQFWTDPVKIEQGWTMNLNMMELADYLETLDSLRQEVYLEWVKCHIDLCLILEDQTEEIRCGLATEMQRIILEKWMKQHKVVV